VSRNASFQNRGPAADVKKVSKELGVQYVVEGSVRRLGDRIRISAQLIETASGNHLWAERYDRDQKDIFTVQDHVVRSLVGTVAGRLEAATAEQFLRKPAASMAAYDYVLRGIALPIGDAPVEAEARRMYEKAIEIDPNYGLAHALLAFSMSHEWFRDETASDAVLKRALELAKKAVVLDDTNSDCVHVLAWVYLCSGAFDLAEYYYKQALELNPNNAVHFTGVAEWLTFVGRAEEALDWFKQAKVVDPHFNPSWFWRTIGVAHFNAHQYNEAITAFHRSPLVPWSQAYIAASHALAGRRDDAKQAAAEVLRTSPSFSIRRLISKEPYKRPLDREHLAEGLIKAGLPN
jgi:adenylate cyclase